MADPSSFLFEDTFTAADWRESIAEGERRNDTISRIGSSCTLTIICDFAKYKSAVKFILGYSWVDENFFLRRFTPQWHPTWPWLFAKSITSIQFAKVSITTDPDTGEYVIDKGTLDWTNAVPFAVYDYAKITAEFTEVRYEVLTDEETEFQSDPTFGLQEWERYVERIPQSYVEVAHIDGGQMKSYAPGVTSMGTTARYIAAPYVLARQEKTAWKLIWREVPEDFLYDGNGFSPKLAAIQKRVNLVTFMGRRPGTLMCESANAEKNPAPIATDQNEGLSFTYDVTFEMKEFNPTPGDPTVEVYGWNLLPGVRQTSSTTGTGTTISVLNEPMWQYFCFTDNGLRPRILGGFGYTQFGYVDFFKVFSHWSINTF